MPKNPATKPQNPTRKPDPQPGPLGEGNYEATRTYNEGVLEHMRTHDVEKEARDAAPSSAAEAKEMKDAEIEGASRAKGEDRALSAPRAKKKPTK